MKHYVKTGTVVSNGFIIFSTAFKSMMIGRIVTWLQGPIGGVGQGGSGSPIIWMALLFILIEAYKMTNEGIITTNCATLQEIKYWIVSYIDDNTIVKSFHQQDTIQQILQSLRESLL